MKSLCKDMKDALRVAGVIQEKEVSQNCFVLHLPTAIFEGSLAQLLRFRKVDRQIVSIDRKIDWTDLDRLD